MSTEPIYNELMAKFKKDMILAIDEARSNLYGTMLPHLSDDTEFNALDLINSSDISITNKVWLATRVIRDKGKLVKFACNCALINIEMVKPYCHEAQYQLIIDYLKKPDAAYEAAAYEAYDAAYTAYAYTAAADTAYAAADTAYGAAYAAYEAAAYAAADTAYAAAYTAYEAYGAAYAAYAADARAEPQIRTLLVELMI